MTRRRAFSTVKFRMQSGDLVVAKSIGSGIALLTQSGATLGQCRVTLDPADTSAVSGLSIFKTEVEITSGAGVVSTVHQGLLSVKPGIIP